MSENQSNESKQDHTILLEDIFYNLPGLIYWKNIHSQYIGFNKNVVELSGLTKEELKGKTDMELNWGQKEAESFQEDDRYVMETGNPKITEHVIPIKRADGKFTILRTEKTRLFDKNGNIAGVLGVAIDITELKHTQHELQETQHKLEAMTSVAASIAHELRTPLLSIRGGMKNIQKTYQELLSIYHQAEENNLPIKKFKPNYLKLREQFFNSIDSEINAANTFINMLLMNVNPSLEGSKSEVFSIAECINETLKRYPFQPGQKKLISWDDKKTDFYVKSNQMLLTHVLFNLLKNSLYFIAEVQGIKQPEQLSLQIWLEEGNPYNHLFFKDTGAGISPEILPYIFDRFFSKTYHGSGIGLTFCKIAIEAMGGTITCSSKEGEYTQFILAFPNEKLHNK